MSKLFEKFIFLTFKLIFFKPEIDHKIFVHMNGCIIRLCNNIKVRFFSIQILKMHEYFISVYILWNIILWKYISLWWFNKKHIFWSSSILICSIFSDAQCSENIQYFRTVGISVWCIHCCMVTVGKYTSRITNSCICTTIS